MAIRGSLRRVLETVTVADLVSGELPPSVAQLAAEYQTATEDRFGRSTRERQAALRGGAGGIRVCAPLPRVGCRPATP